jgi:hypothetical protein
MDSVATATLPRISYYGLGAVEGTKPFGISLEADSYSVVWDMRLLSSSRETKAIIEVPTEAHVWETPEVREMLAQPFGAPVKLTREQAIEIVKDSFGSRPDLPEGREYVRDIRLAFGESILRKSSGESG